MFGRIDHQHALGQTVLTGFDQQRRHQDRVRRLGARQVLADFLADQRVQQGLQPAPLLGVLENQAA
ncbi:hypothetical protein D3C72_2472050 [compost metagenome]